MSIDEVMGRTHREPRNFLLNFELLTRKNVYIGTQFISISLIIYTLLDFHHSSSGTSYNNWVN